MKICVFDTLKVEVFNLFSFLGTWHCSSSES